MPPPAWLTETRLRGHLGLTHAGLALPSRCPHAEVGLETIPLIHRCRPRLPARTRSVRSAYAPGKQRRTRRRGRGRRRCGAGPWAQGWAHRRKRSAEPPPWWRCSRAATQPVTSPGQGCSRPDYRPHVSTRSNRRHARRLDPRRQHSQVHSHDHQRRLRQYGRHGPGVALPPLVPLQASQILLDNVLSDVPTAALAGDRVDAAWVGRPDAGRWGPCAA